MRTIQAVDDAPDTNPSAADAAFLNTDDLVTGGYQLNIACYADSTDTTAARMEGWDTGADHYVRVYTPVAASETPDKIHP